MKALRNIFRVGGLAVLSILLSACGGGARVISGASDPSALSPSPPCGWDQMEASRGLAGINLLVSQSEAAVLAKVVSIAPARWNSKDGSKWCPPFPGGTRPILYRDATIEVKQSVFSGTTLAAQPGDTFNLRLFGDGTPTGKAAAEWNDGSIIYENQVDGIWEVDSMVLVLVGISGEFPTEVGTEVINQVVGSWQGQWVAVEEHDRAESLQPGRTVSLSALINRLAEERQLGRDGSRDSNTAQNPLGGPKGD